MEVSSSLNNRLLARGYYEQSLALSMQLMMGASNTSDLTPHEAEETAPVEKVVAPEELEAAKQAESIPPMPGMNMGAPIVTHVRDYGMTGRVVLKTYKRI